MILTTFSFLLTSCGDVESNEKSLMLNGPEDKAVVEIMTTVEKGYAQAMYEQDMNVSSSLRYAVNDLGGDKVKVKNYLSYYTNGKGNHIDLSFEHKGFGNNKSYCVHLSTKEDFSDEIKIYTRDNNYQAKSLKANTTYYWKVSSDEYNITSSTKSFKTTVGYRGIDAGLTSNIRDIGGHLAKDNKIIKQGLIYRGCELNPDDYVANNTKHTRSLDDIARKVLKEDLKIKTEIDLRGEKESNSISSSNLGEDVTYIRQSIGAYGGLVTDMNDKTNQMVKTIFKTFTNVSEDNPIYFHCMGGADRTGTVAFLLGGLLGMSYVDLIIDFELTSFSYNLREHDVVGTYSDFPSLIRGLKEVSGNANNSNPDIQKMCETYLINKVGLTQMDINSIKERMLEDYHA